MALSTEALAWAQNQDSSVLSVEEFVPRAEVSAVIEHSRRIGEAFSHQLSEQVRFEEVAYPEVDWYAQLWFFWEVETAARLAEALERAGFREFLWIGPASRRPAIFFYRSDVVRAVLKDRWGDRLQTSSPAPAVTAPPTRSGPIHALRRAWARWRVRRPARPCRVVAALEAAELDYFGEAAAGLGERWGGDFQVWFRGVVPAYWRGRSLLRRLRCFDVNPPTPADPDLASFFEGQWRGWPEFARRFSEREGCPWIGTGALDFHFEYYFLERWPRLAMFKRNLERWLRRARPQWLLSSSMYEAEVLLLFRTARSLGIRTAALPHGVWTPGSEPLECDLLVCGSRYERDMARRACPSDRNVLMGRHGASVQSYVVRPEGIPSMSEGRWVLLLSGTPDVRDQLMPTIRRKIFLQQLRAMLDPPSRLGDVRVLLKCHPRGDLSRFLTEAARPPRGFIAPADSPISELLSKAWVIVLADHVGSIVPLALSYRKPVVFYQGADLIVPPAGRYDEEFRRFSLAAGSLVEEIEAFWALLERLAGSAEAYEEAARRARAFAETYLTPESRSLADALESCSRPGVDR